MTTDPTPTEADHDVGRRIVTEWSESEGKGLALSIIIAKALATTRAETLESFREWLTGFSLADHITRELDARIRKARGSGNG